MTAGAAVFFRQICCKNTLRRGSRKGAKNAKHAKERKGLLFVIFCLKTTNTSFISKTFFFSSLRPLRS